MADRDLSVAELEALLLRISQHEREAYARDDRSAAHYWARRYDDVERELDLRGAL